VQRKLLLLLLLDLIFNFKCPHILLILILLRIVDHSSLLILVLLLFLVCLLQQIHPPLQALPLLLILVLHVALHLLQAMLRSCTQPWAICQHISDRIGSILAAGSTAAAAAAAAGTGV
jgi:hypothetical protein